MSVLSSIISLIGSGGGVGSTTPAVDLAYIDKPSFAGSALPGDMAALGSPSYTVSGGKINFTGNPNNLTTGIRSTLGVLAELSTIEVVFTINALTASDLGIAVGWESYNPHGYKHTIRAGYITASSNANFGKIDITANTPTSDNLSASQVNTNVAAGDVCKISFQRLGLTVKATLENVTKGWSIVNQIATAPTGSPFSTTNSAYPCIYHIGGSVSVSSFKYIVNIPEGLDMMNIGDSITYGQTGTTAANRYIQKLNNYSYNIGSGGGADVTSSVVNRLAEIIAISPQRVTLMIGGNDLLFGIASATWQANYANICNTLTSAGIEVIHLLPTPRNNTNVTPLKNYIQSTFTSDTIIDTYTALWSGSGTSLKASYDSGDGLHPNDAGHQVIANTINTALGL